MTVEIAPETENLMTYDDAILYCQFCTYGGYTDWRLPSLDEWYTSNVFFGCWYSGRADQDDYFGIALKVIPVRDIC